MVNISETKFSDSQNIQIKYMGTHENPSEISITFLIFKPVVVLTIEYVYKYSS